MKTSDLLFPSCDSLQNMMPFKGKYLLKLVMWNVNILGLKGLQSGQIPDNNLHFSTHSNKFDK